MAHMATTYPRETVIMTKAKASPLEKGKAELSSPPQEQQIAEAVGTFAEVYKLLEEYAPAWYSSKMRRRVQTALRSLRHLAPDEIQIP